MTNVYITDIIFLSKITRIYIYLCFHGRLEPCNKNEIARWRIRDITWFAESKEALENTCKLTGLQKEDIAELLTSTLINPRSSWQRHTACRRNLNTEDACRYRLHSIIRHLYDLLFHWLINSINGILSTRLFSERLGIIRNLFNVRNWRNRYTDTDMIIFSLFRDIGRLRIRVLRRERHRATLR